MAADLNLDRTFFEQYLAGDVEADDIDDFVDFWHSQFAGSEVYPPLHDFLGMQQAEYSAWVADSSSLPRIRMARLNNRSKYTKEVR